MLSISDLRLCYNLLEQITITECVFHLTCLNNFNSFWCFETADFVLQVMFLGSLLLVRIEGGFLYNLVNFASL